MKNLTEQTFLSSDSKDLGFAEVSSLRNCVFSLQELPKQLPSPPSLYMMYPDQLMGLNFLLVIFPENIHFLHENPNCLEYMKLVVELIFISETPEEFISRIYSRSTFKFLESGKQIFSFSRLNLQKQMFGSTGKSLKSTLNEFTQWSYLANPVENSLLEDTLSRLSSDGRKRYETFLAPFLKGGLHLDGIKGLRLLPCWPPNEPVPNSKHTSLPLNLSGEMEPNTTTFFYGALWLNKKETFQAVREKLKMATLSYFQIDLFKEDLFQIFDFDVPAVFYSSRLEQNNRFHWLNFKEKCRKRCRESSEFLLVVTSEGGGELISHNASKEKVSTTFSTLQDVLDGFGIKPDEGHIIGEELHFFEMFLKKNPSIKKIMEIGFNAGHSSELFLRGREDTQVVSFDIMDHDYGFIGKDYIDYTFPERHQLVIGDSRYTVPKFSRNSPECKFDLIFIDGCHEESFAAADIANSRKLAHPGTWVLIDDIEPEVNENSVKWFIGPTMAWNQAIKEGILVEVERHYRDGRGWAVGKYMFKKQKSLK